jgi:signal transduction histidine kinase
VREMYRALRGMLRPLLNSEAVRLSFDMPDQDIQLFTDEGKLSQILRNFISNALKFTESGSVQVLATLRTDDGTVQFSVADTGLGIADEDLHLIFEEFSQVKNRLQHRVKGTGLGLPLCRNLATLLGGSLTLQSTPGQGSTFSVIIPSRYNGLSGAEAAHANANGEPDNNTRGHA